MAIDISELVKKVAGSSDSLSGQVVVASGKSAEGKGGSGK